jgi:hypothetical protein
VYLSLLASQGEGIHAEEEFTHNTYELTDGRMGGRRRRPGIVSG